MKKKEDRNSCNDLCIGTVEGSQMGKAMTYNAFNYKYHYHNDHKVYIH